VDETDKVHRAVERIHQLFPPRGENPPRAKLALNSAIGEVMRALGHDIDEKKIKLENERGDLISIEADEQLLRQVLFNLLLNAIQGRERRGRNPSRHRQAKCDRGIHGNPRQRSRRSARTPPGNFQALFHHAPKKGPASALAVVQQIVLAHGWEIECLPNEPKGRSLPHHPLETGRLISHAQKLRRKVF